MTLARHIPLALCICAAAPATAQVLPAFGSERAGISIVSALKVGVGARPAALGDAFAAIADDAGAVFWNPAGVAVVKGNRVGLHAGRLYGDIEQYAASGILHLSEEAHLGVSLSRVGVPDMPVTTETNPYGTGEMFRWNSTAVGITYSHRFTDQFTAGATVRYASEVVGTTIISGTVLDIGTLYYTGLGTTRFAVAVSNFGGQMKPSGAVPSVGGTPVSSFQEYAPPTVFRIGIASELVDQEAARWTVAGQLDHPADNAESYTLATEYALRFSEGFPAWLTVRGSYMAASAERSWALGAGVALPAADMPLQVDYAASDYAFLGIVHRLSIGFSF